MYIHVYIVTSLLILPRENTKSSDHRAKLS
jgi:hypothetical protein